MNYVFPGSIHFDTSVLLDETEFAGLFSPTAVRNWQNAASGRYDEKSRTKGTGPNTSMFMNDDDHNPVPVHRPRGQGTRLRKCRTSSHFIWKWTAPVLLCFLFCGCRLLKAKTEPSIEITKVPAADVGGSEKMDVVEGRATGVRPGQQIVLYAKSAELWWVQPFSSRPFTRIQDNSRWKSQTHLGTEYAALLVEPGYVPSDTAESLPSAGGGVVAEAAVKGQGPAPPPIPVKTLHFSGYDWKVRTAASFRGGSESSFDPANAWTDENGALHLRIAKTGGKWTCAEVKLARNLGYGTYVFTVRDTSHLEPSAVLTLFTWDDLGSEQKRRELDIEVSSWGYRRKEHAGYVVQPYYIPTNVVRFAVPAGVLTHSFHWEPGQVTFSTVGGSGGAAKTHVVNSHVFTSGVPSAGGDSVHMNLYIFGKGEIPVENETEVVIQKFEYLP